MKVHIITTETFPNGLAATQRIRCYAKSIVELGYECEVLCLNRCENLVKPLGNNEVKGEIEGYSYHYMGASTALSSNRFINTFHQVLDTLQLVREMLFTFKREDKIIFYSYNAALLNIVQRIAEWRNLDIYYEINEHPSIQIKNFVIEDDSEMDRELIKKRLKVFKGFFCISTHLKDLLVKCGIEERRVHVVNMIVDSARFEGIEKKTSDKFIAYCGAADNNKDGVDQLIRAFAIIASKYSELKLYIMGPKRSDCKNEELAHALGVQDKIVFTGMIASSDIPQMLKNATVVALARPDSIQAKYGFPTKLGEYLSTSNPVVITSVGDISLFLKDGESAFIAEPDSVESFATKLDEALSNPGLAKQIGENGKNISEKYFSNSMVKEQLKRAMNLRS